MAKSRTAAALLPSRMPASFEDVLVYCDGSPEAMTALAYAEALVPDGNVAALMLCMLPSYPSSEFATELWVTANREAELKAEQDEARLRERLRTKRSRAEVRRANLVAGEESKAFAEQALYADLSVIGWPTDTDDVKPGQIFEGALFHSGRPVILVPANYRDLGPPRTVLLAWNPSREAARAVNDALPLMRQASHVRVAIVADGWVRQEENPGDDIARHLARHDVRVDIHHIPSNAEPAYKVLLDEARMLGADMLVMGGYSHSRTAEWLFGGTTRDMLAKANVPVLMSH